jgi:dihydrofolate reductase
MTLINFSMSASVDGFVTDRAGSLDWGGPSDEIFAFHLELVGELGAYLLGRRLYETMRVWETDPAMRSSEAQAAFADVWTALPKVVFSRTLDRVEGSARLASGSLAEEIEATRRDAGGKPVSIGGADLAAQALELDLVDELRIFRYPVILGGGIPLLPPVTQTLPLERVELRPFGGKAVFERYRRPVPR